MPTNPQPELLPSLPQRMTPEERKEFNKDCREYYRLRERELAAKKAAEVIKARILQAVDRFGLIPAHAERSRRIETASFVGTATVSVPIEINTAKVIELELMLSRLKLSKYFPLMFKRDVSYSMAPTANTVIETTPWPKKHREVIVTTFALCSKPKPKAPSLDVEPRAVVRAREEKAAAKSAKKARGGKVAA